MPAPPVVESLPSSVIDAARSGGYHIADTPEWILKVLSNNLSTAAVEGVADEAVIDTEVVGAVTAALGAGTLCAVFAAILCAFILLFIFMNVFKSQLEGIPLGVGPKLADSVDWVDHFLEGPAHAVENACYAAWNDILKHFRLLCFAVLGISAIPGTRVVMQTVTAITQPLAKVIYHIDQTTMEIDKIVTEQAAHIGAQTHALWSRITSLEDWIDTQNRRLADLSFTITWMRQQIEQLWNWMHQVLQWIHALQASVQVLFTDVAKLQQEVLTLQKQVDQLTKRVTFDERVLEPAAEIASIVALLSPLLVNGPAGIDILTRLETDPCMCFKIPGSDAWWLEVAVGDLIVKGGF